MPKMTRPKIASVTRAAKTGTKTGAKKPAPVEATAEDAALEDDDDLSSLLFTTADLIDTFSLEGLAFVGPLPHLLQPVPCEEPSPGTRGALPTWESKAPVTVTDAVEKKMQKMQKTHVGAFNIRYVSGPIRPPSHSVRRPGFVMQIGTSSDPLGSTHIPTFFPVARMFNRLPKVAVGRAAFFR